MLAQFFCLAGHFPRYLDLCRCEFTAQSPTMVWVPQKSPCLQGLCLGLGVHMNEPLTPPSTNLRPACISCWALLEGTGNISAEAAALQRCRGCRRTCCDCLRALWPFCRHLEGTVLCSEGLGNPTCKATALSTEMQRMKSPEQRVCTRAAHDTSPGTRGSLLGHRMHQSQLKYQCRLGYTLQEGTGSPSPQSISFWQVSEEKTNSVKNALDNTENNLQHHWNIFSITPARHLEQQGTTALLPWQQTALTVHCVLPRVAS